MAAEIAGISSPCQIYFLNRFSNACRASFGRRLAGVDVSFSLATRIS
jgi:hypothetical protein